MPMMMILLPIVTRLESQCYISVLYTVYIVHAHNFCKSQYNPPQPVVEQHTKLLPVELQVTQNDSKHKPEQ